MFSSDGRFETQWGNLSRAAAIIIDDRSGEELLYIGEYFCGIGTNDIGTDLGPRVTVHEHEGQGPGQGRARELRRPVRRFYSPHGIAIDSNGDLYVAEVAWTDYGRHMDPPRELRSMQKLVRVRTDGRFYRYPCAVEGASARGSPLWHAPGIP